MFDFTLTKQKNAQPLLKEIISQSNGTQAFLQNVLEYFVNTYSAVKGSIFIYDNVTREFTQKAAYGFPMFPKARIILKIGEGIIGRSLAERRTIYTESAASMRGYIRHHNFPDDDTQTYLAVPLLQGKERVGAILLLRPTGEPFLAEEISSIRENANDVVSAIQNASALISIESAKRDIERGMRPLEITGELSYRGSSVSHGWGIGVAHIFARKYSRLTSAQLSTAKTVRSIDEAIELVEKKLKESTEALNERLPEAASLIFESSAMIMRDDNFLGKIKTLISDKDYSTPKAIVEVGNEFIKLFEASEDEYMQEKARDVEDLTLQLLEAVSEETPEYSILTRPHIIIADKLLPSDILRIAQGNVKGIALIAGGATAHVSLLVRSLDIPTIIVKELDLLRIPNGQEIIIDCANDYLYVNPSEERRYNFELRSQAQKLDESNITANNPANETVTLDGERITLMANINLIADVQNARKANFDGIGLYRTEFPFIMRQSLPTEAEQVKIYTRLIQEANGKPITFRTLDAGGDKVLPYLYKTKEENPAMGLRSMRFTLRYTNIMDQQLRAILRAIQYTGCKNASIMFPMISSVEEMIAAKERLWGCVDSIQAELGDKELIIPNIGTMVEIPAILAVLDKIAEESDFFSIGTNDLIQYTLGVDRTNDSVASYYLPHHPAILRSLKTIADVAKSKGVHVSVCGEMGRDPRYIPFFIGIGLRCFSIEAIQITRARELISRFTIKQCEEYANDLLSLSLTSEIENRIDEFTDKIFSN
jgi:phosphotransferase system enzyme I (PtsP)